VLIALVEDDEATASLFESWLHDAGHDCMTVANGSALIRMLRQHDIELVILDWLLPDIDGLELMRWVREQISWTLPVIFVTQRDSENDIVQGLNAGADDYMTKPVSRRELLARIAAVSRRNALPETGRESLELGAYRIDTRSRSIRLHGEPIDLTQKEFDLALLLFRSAGRLLSRGLILESVWGLGPDISTRTVDTHMSRIRQKLALRPENGWRLKALYQHGYRLEPADSGD
jgi:DNA-binding response OmpR family regulator